MNRHIVVPAMVALLSFSVVPASQAAMFGRTEAPTMAKAATVKISVRNSSLQAVTLQAGDSVISLAAGETRTVTLPDGLRLTSVTATASRPAGALVVQVCPMLRGNTVVLS